MKVLVLNGSPKPNHSNSLRLTHAFLEGMGENRSLQTEILSVYKMNIKPCTGCFHCWKNTPGKCCIQDDMASVIEKILDADIIIWSFPLYYYGLPSQLKALMDRQLPMNLPFMARCEDGNPDSGGHPPRYDLSGKRYVLISTCGFYTAEGNYDAVNLMFDRCFGKGGYETLYCGQGELFHIPQLRQRTDTYLEYVKRAGAEYITHGITAETRKNLSELLYSRDAFEQMADASWGIEPSIEAASGGTKDMSLPFTRQMAALYNSNTWKNQDRVLEIQYTDMKKTYQIVMGKEDARVLTEDFLPCTTKIETPFEVWEKISRGEIGGPDAMMQRLYRVEGDFDLMVHWDYYFGSPSPSELSGAKTPKQQKTNMTLLLLPWFPVWIGMSINPFMGGIISIAVCALLPFGFLKWKPTIFECISFLAVSLLGILGISGYPITLLLPFSYLLFGVMWTVTLWRKIPLTAHYSMYDYGGEKALENPLFVQTNRILTGCWAVLYLLTPIWTYFLILSPFSFSIVLVNSLLPSLLGVFTVWFQKWYPSYYAGLPGVKA